MFPIKRKHITFAIVVTLAFFYKYFEESIKESLKGYEYLNILFFILLTILGFTEFITPLKKIKEKTLKMLQIEGKDSKGPAPVPVTEIEQKNDKNDLAKIIRGRLKKSPLVKNHLNSGSNFIPINLQELQDSASEEIVIDSVDHELFIQKNRARYLIIGEPGSGKSALFYEGFKRYLESIDFNESNLKVPFFINLSSWNPNEGSDFKVWLKNKLKAIGVPEKLFWIIEHDQIIPFLDGFDEVPAQYRKDCFLSIITFASENSLFLNCRKEEFNILYKNSEKEKIDTFFRVMEIKLLKDDVIDKAISGSKHGDVDALKSLSHKIFNKIFDNKETPGLDKESETLRTPLVVNLLISVFSELSKTERKELQEAKKKHILNLLWKKYDEKRFKIKQADQGKDYQWLRARMVYIAKLIDKTSFSIHDIQPDWLLKLKRSKKTFGFVFYYFLSRIAISVSIAVGIGLIVATPYVFVGNAVFLSPFVVGITLLMDKYVTAIKKKWLTSFLFIGFFAVLAGLYQGFSVPRYDQRAWGFSFTESISGIIFGLFYSTVFWNRLVKQKEYGIKGMDILPIKKYYVSDFLTIIKIGLRKGAFMGLLGGIVALIIHNTDLAKSLKNDFIIPFLNQYIHSGALINDVFLFILASFLGFVLGFVANSILQVLNNKKIIDGHDENSTFGLNSGLYSTFWNAFKKSLYIFLLTAFISINLIYSFNGWKEVESIYRGFNMGLGIGLVSFLLIGGIEIISHSILRMLLYFYGILPFNFSIFAKQTKDLQLIQIIGGNLTFLHPTLKSYYRTEVSLAQTPQIPNEKKYKTLIFMVFTCSILFSLLLLARPFYARCSRNPEFWPNPEKGISIGTKVTSDKFNIDYAQNRVIIKQNGRLIVQTSGKIYLGTFLGETDVYGTELGFFGFPVGDGYNIEIGQRHGALVYRKCNGQRKSNCCVSSKKHTLFYHNDIDTLAVEEGDTLAFLVNDKEYQNNKGGFLLNLKFDAALNPKKETKQ